MRIEIGEPAGHVTVTPFGPGAVPDIGGDHVTHAAGFAVRCARCGCTVTAYLPVVRRDPGLIARTVETHNACREGGRG